MGVGTVPINLKAKDFYSVEISHIYLDQPFSVDQIRSVESFHDLVQNWNKPHDEIVLFDNYNVTEIKTPYEDVLDQLKELDATPKYFAFEKDLVQYSQYLIDNIKIPKIKKQYETYISKNNKYPCSLLTATWYLMRLGYIEDTKKIIKTVKNTGDYESVMNLINFLPAHFLPVEEKSKKLIQATIFSDAVNQIENVFFDSDETDPVIKKDLI